MGKDHTLHAAVSGIVRFQKKKNNKSYVSIEPLKAEQIRNKKSFSFYLIKSSKICTLTAFLF